MSDLAFIQRAARKAWKLIGDENFQNKHQMRANLRGNVQRVRNLDSLGSIDCPIGVNGAYGEITYLSLLRTGTNQPFAFHRQGSVQGPNGLVDKYQLLSIDVEIEATLHLDPYFKKRSRQAPAGLKLAREFYPGNPVFGCNFFVADFPVGIAEATREMQKKIYGVPLPVEALRKLEANFISRRQ